MSGLVEELSIKLGAAIDSGGIVHAVHVDLHLRAVNGRLAGIGGTECGRASGVESVYHLGKMACHTRFGLVLFLYLVARAP